MNGGLEKLSVLIPLAGSEKVKLLLQKQLMQWNETGLDMTIDPNLFSIYQMLAGLNLTNYGTGAEGIENHNVLENLDWRRAFGFFLSFSTVSSDNVGAALEEFIVSYMAHNSAWPSPGYKEKLFKPVDGYFPECQYNDICFILIKLFCNQ